MHPSVDLIVPVKPLTVAKSRLRGAADDGVGNAVAHARLALALAHDTISAVRGSARVRYVIVISSDAVVDAEFTAAGLEVVADGPLPGLNAAFERGAALLRGRDPRAMVGALQADLPSLRSAELDAAIDDAVALFAAGASRAFCADADGTGTTFLLAAPGVALDPRFGAGSAVRHRDSGALALPGDRPGLRRDVDTSEDLRHAAGLGLGARTTAALSDV